MGNESHATEIKMPQLSDTMDSGKILIWNKAVGDVIKRGDILAEVETDKANLEIESFLNGTLLEICVPQDDTAKVGQVIAIIGEPGSKAASPQAAPPSSSIAAPAISVSPVATLAPQPSVIAANPNTEAISTENEHRIKASPLAKKLAEERGVNLSGIAGSGPNGRVTKKDVEELAAKSPFSYQPAAATPVAAQPVQQITPKLGTPAPMSTPSSGGTLTSLSKMRATIARRMQEAVVQAPHFYTTASINMSAALAFRQQCKEDAALKDISINHLVMKAVGYGLSKEPRVNCSVKHDGGEDKLFTPESINIGIITALPDGLLIPVIRDVDKLSLRDLAFEAKAAIDRARAGRPTALDLSGGTFSISNMGMFDVENFTAIINPGQGAILAVSSVVETPIVEKGQIIIAPMMKVTLSVDHRIIDGLMAGAFLKALKAGLEHPALLLV
jgi:pyruvate dehydrogenase E2 component (dihydrolipoamide acetyltransferase)